jgi:pyruvate/2-oxoglutarate dehydrogenase complex dihydrolipoamide acyltransferase (E2) component
VLVEIETDKVVLEVPASADGILDAVLEDEGTTVTSRQILGRLREGNSAGKESSAKLKESVYPGSAPAGVSGRAEQRCAQPGDPSPAG